MADGTDYEVEVMNPDLVRYDVVRTSKKWGTAQDAPILWLTYVTWCAMSRGKLLAGPMPWEVFERDALKIRRTGSVVADPMSPELGPG